LPDARAPWIIVGCDDGTVAALDGTGILLRLGKMTGRPTHAEVLQTETLPLAVLATDQGEVKGFKIAD
jgi:hypothetical protein